MEKKRFKVIYQNISELEKAGMMRYFWEREITFTEIASGLFSEVATVYAESMEEVFFIMNGQSTDNPNPLESANAQKWIRNTVKHTSMSVNDVILDEDMVYYRVAGIGFEEITE